MNLVSSYPPIVSSALPSFSGVKYMPNKATKEQCQCTDVIYSCFGHLQGKPRSIRAAKKPCAEEPMPGNKVRKTQRKRTRLTSTLDSAERVIEESFGLFCNCVQSNLCCCKASDSHSICARVEGQSPISRVLNGCDA